MEVRVISMYRVISLRKLKIYTVYIHTFMYSTLFLSTSSNSIYLAVPKWRLFTFISLRSSFQTITAERNLETIFNLLCTQVKTNTMKIKFSYKDKSIETFQKSYYFK